MTLDARTASRRFHDAAEQARRCGRNDQALQHAAEALRIDPDNIDARITEAHLRLENGQWRQAAAALDAAAFNAPDVSQRPDVAWLGARIALAADRPNQAASLLATLIAHHPDDERFRWLMLDVGFKLNDRAGAIAQLRELCRIRPNDDAARRMLARLVGQQNPQAAASMLAAQPDEMADPRTRFEIAQCHIASQRLADADAVLRRVLIDQPHDAAVWLEAGRVADEMGDWEAAQRRYTKAAAQGGRVSAAAAAAMAACLMRQGRFAPACRWWRRAARPGGEHAAAAWAGLATAALHANRPRLAARAKQRLADAADRSDQQRLFAEATLHAAGGKLTGDAANGELDEASPLNALLHRSARALEDATKRHDWADLRYHAAVCRAAMGDGDMARRWTQAALDVNPHYRAAARLAAKLPRLPKRAA